MRKGVGESVRAWCAEEVAFRRPLLFAPVALGSGCLWWFTRMTDPDPFALGVASVAGLMVALFFRSRRPVVALSGLALALFGSGALLAMQETLRADTVLLDSPLATDITGRIDGREQVANGGWRYRITLLSTARPTIGRPPLRITLVTRDATAIFSLGDQVMGRARLSPPSGPALPGLDDFAFSAFFAGQGASGFFLGTPKRLSTAPPGLTAAVSDRLLALRSQVGDHIRAVVPGDAGAFAAALVTDERRAISSATTEALRQAGLAHIIAISGLNMALASGIFFVGLRSLMALSPAIAHGWPVRRLAAFGALLGVSAYYAISGFAVSAERAYLMSVLVLVAIIIGRPALNLFNLALAAMVVLILQPSALMGASFQMSFAATLGLIAGYEAMTRRRAEGDQRRDLPVALTIARAAGLFIAGVLVTSLIGSLATAPFAVAHFHRFALYGLLANLLAMPLISFIVMPAGLVAMLVMPFGLDAPFLTLMGIGLEGVIAIARMVADLGGDWLIPQGDGRGLPVIAAGFLLLCLLRTPLRIAGLPLIALGISLLAVPKALPDLVVSEDGALVAMMTGDGLATNRASNSGFIIDQWQAALGESRLLPPVIVPRIDQTTTGRFTCIRKAWCLGRLESGELVATVEDLDLLQTACRAAGLVIATRNPRRPDCGGDARLITPALLRATGSLALAAGAGEGWTAVPAFASLHRPWQHHHAYDWRQRRYDERATDALARLFNGSGE